MSNRSTRCPYVSARRQREAMQRRCGLVALVATLVAFVALLGTAAALDAHNGTAAAASFAAMMIAGTIALVALVEGSNR